jgi:hypothetical protein
MSFGETWKAMGDAMFLLGLLVFVLFLRACMEIKYVLAGERA